MKTIPRLFKRISILICVAAGTVLVQGCHKNPGGGTPPTNTDGCLLLNEFVSGGPGYVNNYTYEYDANGILTKGSIVGTNGNPPVQTLGVTGNTIAFSTGPTFSTTYNYVGDLRKGIPTSSYTDISVDGLQTGHFREYTYGYDKESRLTNVGYIAGAITFFYDEKGNVTKIVFYSANDVRLPIVIATLENYDDKPTPFVAEGKFWKFIQHMFSWDYFTDYLLVAALTNNNPGKMTIQSYIGNDIYSTSYRDMHYTYDDQGHVMSVSVDDTDAKGKKTHYQSATFQYKCK
jgi:hypothetical protein